MGQRIIRDAGGALEDMSCDGVIRRKPGPFQVVDCCGYNTAGVCDRLRGDGVHMGYHCNYPTGKQGVPYHRHFVDALEPN